MQVTYVLDKIPGLGHTLVSSDKVIKANPNDIAEITFIEYFKAVNVSDVPQHELNLKMGTLVIFI